MINTETEAFVDNEVERLYQIIEDLTGPLTTDGGDLGSDIYGSMPQLGCEMLTEMFLQRE